MAREAELFRLAYTRADLDAPFQRLVRQVAELFEAPYAALTFVDRDYTHVRTSIGLKAETVPRDLSFCRHVIETEGVLVTADARQRPEFATLPIVTGEPHLRYHATAPVTSSAGVCLGALFVSDTKPRARTSASRRRQLAAFAQTAADLLELGAAAAAPAGAEPPLDHHEDETIGELLAALNTSALASISFENALQRAAEHICARTGWPLGGAWLVGADGQMQAVGGSTAEFGPELARMVASTKAFLSFESLAPLAETSAASKALAAGAGSWFALPVRDGPRVAAVLEFFSDGAEMPTRLFPGALPQMEMIFGRVLERVRSSTALEAMARQLREQTDFLQKVFDNIDAGVVVSTGEALVVANDRFRELFDLPKAVCSVGVDLTRLSSTQMAIQPAKVISPELGDFMDQVAEWFGDRNEAPEVLSGPRGRSYELRQRQTPSGRMVGTVRDVTEQTVALDRTHQSQKMEALGELAGGVAHEFNNLLLVISGFAQSAYNRASDPAEVRSAMEEVLAASERAASIAGQMLTFSRNWVSERKVISLKQALDQLRSMLAIQSRGVQVEIDVEPGLNIQADPSHFSQAMLNLALNARDAMPKGGVLEISARRVVTKSEIRSRYGTGQALKPGEYAEISVRDTGSGIPEAVLGRVFEPFFTTKAPGKGTGLGLSFVFGVVKQAGGLLDVHSRVGEGTTFVLHLPSTAEPAAAAAKPTPYVGGEETIIVVDDEVQVRTVASLYLEDLGYTVLQAGSAVEALELFDEHRDRVALVLTDVIMPHIDGIELAQTLVEIGCERPIAFMTGCVPDLERDGERLRQLRDIIQKPFGIKEFALFTRRVLDQQREAA